MSGVIVVLFVEAVRQTYTNTERKQEHNNADAANFLTLQDDRARLFRAQRNLYLAGGVLVLSGVIARLFALNRQVVSVSANAVALQKQLTNTSNFASTLLAGDSKDTKPAVKEEKKGDADLKKEEKTSDDFPAVPKEDTGLKKRK